MNTDRTTPTTARTRKRSGFSLVELLVAMSIMVILAAIMIPRLRVFNEERNIREAARVAGSIFSNASNRAIAEGAAGIVIERSQQLVDLDGVNFAGTTLYEMRSVPSYLGDEMNAVATRMADYQIQIPLPLEFYPVGDLKYDVSIVKVNDYISVNNSSVRYLINNVTVSGINLTLDLSSGQGAAYLPVLPGTNSTTYPFVIHRQPRKLESSRVVLPDGFLIDLRYSGPINPNPDVTGVLTDSPRAWFHEIIKPGYHTANNRDRSLARTIQIMYKSDGRMDRIYFYDPTLGTNGEFTSRIPIDSLYLLVTKLEIDPLPNHGQLDLDTNYWITINNSSGGVNVGYNAGFSGNYDMDKDGQVGMLSDKILEARGLSQGGASAVQ